MLLKKCSKSQAIDYTFTDALCVILFKMAACFGNPSDVSVDLEQILWMPVRFIYHERLC